MLSRAIFRALCALLVGILLVSNPTDMTVLIVQVIGGIFTLSGLVAILGYFTARARQSGLRLMFPVVGIGSLAFGVFLLLMPAIFVDILMYALGILLALTGITQIVNIISFRSFAPVSWSLFVLPLLFVAMGILLLCFPLEAASASFTILGIGYILYGVSEFLFGIHFYRYRRLSPTNPSTPYEEESGYLTAQEITEETRDDAPEVRKDDTPSQAHSAPSLTGRAGEGPGAASVLLFLLLFSLSSTAQNINFTVAAMNVDGLPSKVGTISINPDAKGSDGARAISQKLSTKDYDIIALSEDFNYHGSIMSAIGDIYNQGTHRGSINAGSSILAILSGLTFDTDGLELLWRKELNVGSESWTAWQQWNGKTDNGADGLIKKGFRYYLADLGGGALVDIYILHMDAEVSAGDIAARESQMRQLADDILRINPSQRPKIVMGDTNCRYTRDLLKTLFIDVINADPRYTIKDAWVEKCKKNIYPTYGAPALMVGDLGYIEGEIVDKIFYINPKYGLQLQLRAFQVDTDFNDERGTPLADHYPVVADFRAHGTLLDPASYWHDSYTQDAYTAYAEAYQRLLPYTAGNLQGELKEELTALLTTHTSAAEASAADGIIARLRAFPDKVEAYISEHYTPTDYTDRIKNPSFEEGQRLVSGDVSGWTVAPDVAEAFISGILDNDEGDDIRAFAPMDGNYVFNTWGGTPAAGFYVRQDITTISGWYRLTATVASDGNNEVRLRLGDNTVSSGPLTDRTRGTLVTLTGYISGKTTIGAESDGWFECDDFHLIYYRPVPTGIDDTPHANGDSRVTAIYTPGGQRLAAPRRGLNLLRHADGTSRKVLLP